MRLLVTGGLGFIGSNFILKILNENKDIEIINIDAQLDGSSTTNLSKLQDSHNYEFIKGNITKDDENELDGYEGVDYNYYHKEYFNLNNRKVLVYIQKKYYIQKPNSTYLHTIIDGYKDCILDIKKLKRIISSYKINYEIYW